MFEHLIKSLKNKLRPRSFDASTSVPPSRSLTFSSLSSSKTCSICLTSLKSGGGQAIFTAECSHSFHFNCIATSVNHGNRICPLCRAKWNDVPSQAPNNGLGRTPLFPLGSLDGSSDSYQPPPGSPSRWVEPEHFTDDEPLPVPVISTVSSKVATINSFTEFPAVAASDSLFGFPVLVQVSAPPVETERAPIDLVCVLDISWSMNGSKLNLLKRAMHFLVENLGDMDRLSIVTFSSIARRVMPLRRMSTIGYQEAFGIVDYLVTDGNTDIVAGLKKGVRVLEERRWRNPVASIILLSDGCDNQYFSGRYGSTRKKEVAEFIKLLPASIRINSNSKFGRKRKHPLYPVHAFGFGTDHDSTVMHAISDGSGGTFSFLESIHIVQDAFAMCIGGLLSVVAQEVRLEFKTLFQGVQIRSVSSGNYRSEVSNRGKQCTIDVEFLYAEEAKDFLIYLIIPKCSSATDGKENCTPLLDVSCRYKDLPSKNRVQTEHNRVIISRPKSLSLCDKQICSEVDRKRNRLLVEKTIAEAKELAEEGEFSKAQELLETRRALLLSSTSAKAGDDICTWLESELLETKTRMRNADMYEHTGRAYALSGLSSHSWQRATTRGETSSQTLSFTSSGISTASGTIAYETPSMVSMVSKSQILAPSPSVSQPLLLKKSSSLKH